MQPLKCTPLSFKIDDILASRMSMSPESPPYHQIQVVPEVNRMPRLYKIPRPEASDTRCSLRCCAPISPSLPVAQYKEYREFSPGVRPTYEKFSRVSEPLTSMFYCATNQAFSSDQERHSRGTLRDKGVPSSGRFRPPPFFETVERLRRRLYELGNKTFGKDEPPTNRSTQKLWRTLEKYNAPYSLQHYFFVASLSSACFAVVGEIVRKVRNGELAGSRENEVNQSYFNFLYGRSESERLRLLQLLRDGVLGVKDIPKANKDKGKASAKSEENSTECKSCSRDIEKLLQENKFLQDELARLYNLSDQSLKSKSAGQKRKMETGTPGSLKFRIIHKDDREGSADDVHL